MGWPNPLTHRQFKVITIWRQREWNRPSRNDHYLMKLIAEVKRIFAKYPNQIKPEDQQIEFVFKKPGEELKEKGGMSVEQATALSRSRWAARRRNRQPAPPPKR